MGVHSGYNSCLLKQKENSGSVTATFRDMQMPNESWRRETLAEAACLPYMTMTLREDLTVQLFKPWRCSCLSDISNKGGICAQVNANDGTFRHHRLNVALTGPNWAFD